MVRLLLFLSLSFALSACSCRPYHPTPLDALTESPGYLINVDYYKVDSVQVLQQEEIAGGLVMLYRWQTFESVKTGTYCVASTFVALENRGWRAQSSGSIGTLPGLSGQLHQCDVPADVFVAAYTVGGNITSLTTAYGISHRGNAVRIVWSDEQIDVVPLQAGSFLLARPEILQVQRIELLDASGNVLESETWSSLRESGAGGGSN